MMVGPAGHFFGTEHTQARYRDAFYIPILSDWRNFETWQEAGSPIAIERANAEWKKRLAAYEALATKKKVFTAKEVEGFTFTPAQRAKMDLESQAFIDRVFFTLRERVEGLTADPDEPPTPKEP